MESTKVIPEGNATVSSATVENQEQHSVDGLLDNIQKLRKEKENFKAKAIELENQLKIKVDNELAQKEEWKTLAEQRSKEVNEWKSKFENTTKMIDDSLKVSALKDELSKLGMDMKYTDMAIKLVNLDTINIDAETKAVLGVEGAARTLKEKAAPLFVTNVTNVSHAAPQGIVKPLTIDEWKQLPTAEKLKRELEVLEGQGIKFKP